ncbi:unnamed protein product [Adineta steineri]|uniref:Beta-1,4-galactosyltransferase n=1 Tax=Adineta steineri TaxID=433720 RepID=A0A818SMT4_9BILA|nr:unnamed protein product [Adineta steineri]CAF3671736.1 unnamed protein product [Adineta steineri]
MSPCVKRKPLFILFFFTQFILFSTYTFFYYINNNETNILTTDVDPLSVPSELHPLPASLLEKGDRSNLNENYKNSRIRTKRKFLHLKTNEDLKSLNVTSIKDIDQSQTIIQCPSLPPNLGGRISPDLFSYNMEEIEEHHMNSSIKLGGHWSPSHCTARHRVAIIIPYRNRDMQLRIFINFMHPFLQKQQLDYQIFLVEPVNDISFNRALLFNIGFREAMKIYSWQCFIFHDVDLIPEDDRNIYSCPAEPRHMSVAVNTLDYNLPYRTIFGGVSALTVKQMESVNGFSNQFFGWGGEDDDMAGRVLTKYRISRYPAAIARYKMLRHKQDTPNSHRYSILGLSTPMRSVDGLSNVQYKIIEIERKKLFTLIRVTYNETLIKQSVAHLQKKKPKSKLKKT